MNKLLSNFGLAGASLLFALLLSEIGLRVLSYRPAMLDRAMFVTTGDTLVPFKLRPGYSGWYAGGYVTVDSVGNRTVRPHTPLLNKADNWPTLLLLGDSQIFGQGLSDDQTTASQLQDSLLARGLSVRVQNIGVPGYTSWNEFAALRDYLSRHHVDAVVLSYVPNDPTFNNDFFGLGHGQFNNVSSSALHRLTQSLYRHVYSAYLLSDTWRRFRSSSKSQLPPLVPSDSAVDYSMAALQRIKKLCQDVGASFSVAVYRDVSTYSAPKQTTEYEHKITEALSRRGIEWFVLGSFTEHLKKSEAMVSWSDPHPSARATSYITSDILHHVTGTKPVLSRAGD